MTPPCPAPGATAEQTAGQVVGGAPRGDRVFGLGQGHRLIYFSTLGRAGRVVLAMAALMCCAQGTLRAENAEPEAAYVHLSPGAVAVLLAEDVGSIQLTKLTGALADRSLGRRGPAALALAPRLREIPLASFHWKPFFSVRPTGISCAGGSGATRSALVSSGLSRRAQRRKAHPRTSWHSLLSSYLGGPWGVGRQIAPRS